ncbi:adenosine deaminase AGSA-like [Physella acuta]|uniref:adenosine deaminase AGSA-like n=1 Tax=Physella acuta TaxID=109671 RepID=UPI0027DBDAF2|nr:adenosine deaminase AGSA-like [Physella acuta]XP_059162000.1 adenosine deaminase AGSA-like [Physella acuta]XP_059162001.1 adenosine deaminase AGSA-like [Physella acuta]XP_059162002.1 adenosine deaminase AGSA-like [Physella acuta]
MRNLFYVSAIVFIISSVKPSSVDPDYMSKRDDLIHDEDSLKIGGLLVLSDAEKVINDTIMKEKIKMINDSLTNRASYIPSLSFFKVKPLIANTTIFKWIQKMPKGGALHVHDLAGASLDWLIKNATYRDNIYMCFDKNQYLLFHAFQNPPVNPDCKWILVKDARGSQDPDAFDAMLKSNLSMMVTDPVETYADNDKAWQRFQEYFIQVYSLIYYAPVFRDYYWRILDEFRADNVQYLELRGQLWGLYDLNGTQYDEEYGLQMIMDVTEQFMKQYPNFIGVKVIMCGNRNSNESFILEKIKTAIQLHQKYPDFMAGFDLVSDEQWYKPLIYYVDALLYPSKQNPPYHLPYFFHAGETDWLSTEVDQNLYDALLLNTTRIGHGYALSKHPKLVKMVKAKHIGVEVNPISNQILRLVTDLRNHPMSGLMRDNFPLVVSSDDPSVWEATPLSHDFYMAFMAMSGEDGDLTFLKQLANNSITYSAMTKGEKRIAFKKWQASWDEFIKETVKSLW